MPIYLLGVALDFVQDVDLAGLADEHLEASQYEHSERRGNLHARRTIIAETSVSPASTMEPPSESAAAAGNTAARPSASSAVGNMAAVG